MELTIIILNFFAFLIVSYFFVKALLQAERLLTHSTVVVGEFAIAKARNGWAVAGVLSFLTLAPGVVRRFRRAKHKRALTEDHRPDWRTRLGVYAVRSDYQ